MVIGGIIASAALSLAEHGVTTVGNIPPGLPKLSFPSVGLDDVTVLVPAAIALFAVGYADGVLTARSFTAAGLTDRIGDANFHPNVEGADRPGRSRRVGSPG